MRGASVSSMGGVFPCAVTWGCDKGKRLAGWELTRQNVLAAHTGLSRRAGETRGVSRTRHKIRGYATSPCLTHPRVQGPQRRVCRCV